MVSYVVCEEVLSAVWSGVSWVVSLKASWVVFLKVSWAVSVVVSCGVYRRMSERAPPRFEHSHLSR